MTDTKDGGPVLTKLSSEYWHLRWAPDLWMQWPVGAEPCAEHGFGWIANHHVLQARLMLAARAPKEKQP